MRLSADKVKEAILHPDLDVREAAVSYFARSFRSDSAVMPLVIQAIERDGFPTAFHSYRFLSDLVQTDATVRWLIQQIKANDPPLLALSSALVHAAPSLLLRNEKTVLSLPGLDDAARDAVRERIRFPIRPPEELWRDLDAFCQKHEADEPRASEDFDLACRLVEALGRYPDLFGDRVLAVLSGDTGDFDNWWEGLAVRLAGEMKLQSAIPFLLELLHDPGDWLLGECRRALARIGGDGIATLLARECPTAVGKLRRHAAAVLGDIPTDRSVQACLDLLKSEKDQELRGRLLQSALLNFATESIEPARHFIRTTHLDPLVLQVRSTLLTVCKLMPERFPEFEAWKNDARNDEEFRRRWHQDHARPVEKEKVVEPVAEKKEPEKEKRVAPPVASVRRPPRLDPEDWDENVGRNDNCPCGSGKKFKKCCMNKDELDDEAASGPAAPPKGVLPGKPPPRYPHGTVAFYGPDDTVTTKIVAGVVKRAGKEPIIERWVGTNVKNNPKTKRQVQQFFEKHGVQSVAAGEGNIGCPHEEGVDFPSGEDCPQCPYWKGKQGTARKT